MDTLLIVMIFAFANWAVAAYILMVRELQKRNVAVGFLGLRLKMFRYLAQYRQLTRKETGHVGPLFYHYVLPLCALTWVAALLVIRLAG